MTIVVRTTPLRDKRSSLRREGRNMLKAAIRARTTSLRAVEKFARLCFQFFMGGLLAFQGPIVGINGAVGKATALRVATPRCR